MHTTHTPRWSAPKSKSAHSSHFPYGAPTMCQAPGQDTVGTGTGGEMKGSYWGRPGSAPKSAFGVDSFSPAM